MDNEYADGKGTTEGENDERKTTHSAGNKSELTTVI
jgi:hypothetical protein